MTYLSIKLNKLILKCDKESNIKIKLNNGADIQLFYLQAKTYLLKTFLKIKLVVIV